MNKIIVLVGISGSGKDYYTQQLLKENPNYLVYNRDSLRESLTGMKASEYNKEPRGYVEKAINNIAITLLSSNNSVISNNTNLKLSYINDYKDYFKPIELVLIDTPLEVCQERVKLRDNLTDVTYIAKQYQQLEELKNHIEFDKILKNIPLWV